MITAIGNRYIGFSIVVQLHYGQLSIFRILGELAYNFVIVFVPVNVMCTENCDKFNVLGDIHLKLLYALQLDTES